MEVNAYLRHLHMAPRKIRLVIDLIRGTSVPEAEQRLSFVKKDAALPVLKLLRSAMANAQHNFKLDPSSLFVTTITADSAGMMKRSRPRAFGRGAPIRKRMTHITLVLSDVAPIKKATKREKMMNAKLASPKKAPAKKKAVTPESATA